MRQWSVGRWKHAQGTPFIVRRVGGELKWRFELPDDYWKDMNPQDAPLPQHIRLINYYRYSV